MNGFPVRPPQSETSRVGLESEVRIPVSQAIIGALAIDIAIIGTFLIWVVALWWQRSWSTAWAWAGRWWGAWIIALLLPSGLFAGLLAFSFGVQTIDKHWPAMRQARDADAGILSGILGHGRKTQRKIDDIYDLLFRGDDNE